MLQLTATPSQTITTPSRDEGRTATDQRAVAVRPWEDLQRDGELREQWRLQVVRQPLAAVELHPDLLCCRQHGSESSPVPGDKRRFVCQINGDDKRLGISAVFEQKRVAVPLLRSLGWRTSLSGLRLVGNQLLGSSPDTPLQPLVAAMDRLLAPSAAACDCLLFEALEVGCPLWQALTAPSTRGGGFSLQLYSPQPHWRIRFPDQPDMYWKKFSSKTRYNFRRLVRLLPHDWQAVESPSQVSGFLDAAAQVSVNSWQGRRLGTRIHRDAGTARYFVRLAELGALRCYVLRQDERPIAFAVGTQWAGRYVLEEIGYDQQFANQSPGTVLLLRMLEDLLVRETPHVLDFGFGDGKYKQLFGTESSVSGNLLRVGRRWKPALVRRMARLGHGLEQSARAFLRSTGLETRLRQRYRR